MGRALYSPRSHFLAAIWGGMTIYYIQKVTEGVRCLPQLGSKIDGVWGGVGGGQNDSHDIRRDGRPPILSVWNRVMGIGGGLYSPESIWQHVERNISVRFLKC